MSLCVIARSVPFDVRSGAFSAIALNADLRAVHSVSGLAQAAAIASSSALIDEKSLPWSTGEDEGLIAVFVHKLGGFSMGCPSKDRMDEPTWLQSPR